MKTVVKTLKDMTILPPAPDVCQTCAVKHDPAQPHNQQSLHYQYTFYKEHDRWPTWADAMAHCSEPVKAQWTKELKKHGITV